MIDTVSEKKEIIIREDSHRKKYASTLSRHQKLVLYLRHYKI